MYTKSHTNSFMSNAVIEVCLLVLPVLPLKIPRNTET